MHVPCQDSKIPDSQEFGSGLKTLSQTYWGDSLVNRHHQKHPNIPLCLPERKTKSEAPPPHPCQATQVGRGKSWSEATGLGSLVGRNQLREQSWGSQKGALGPLSSHRLASLQMAASASHSQAATLWGLPYSLTLGITLCPGAMGPWQAHTSNKEAAAGFLPFGKEGRPSRCGPFFSLTPS